MILRRISVRVDLLIFRRLWNMRETLVLNLIHSNLKYETMNNDSPEENPREDICLLDRVLRLVGVLLAIHVHFALTNYTLVRIPDRKIGSAFVSGGGGGVECHHYLRVPSPPARVVSLHGHRLRIFLLCR